VSGDITMSDGTVPDFTFEVMGIEHEDGLITLIAFRNTPRSRQDELVRQLLATVGEEHKGRIVDATRTPLSKDVVRRIYDTFLKENGNIVICPAKRPEAT
jgi:hypothetical protein